MISDNCRLQFITHCNNKYSHIESALIALKGGCRWIQLRMKGASESLLEEAAIIIQRMCKDYGATFIIDDNVFLAKKLKADGVHLGKNDMTITTARKILGDRFIIGSTVNSFNDILSVIQVATPNYFGCGPLRFTSTKKNLAPTLGYDGYKNIILKMRGQKINIPLIAIGGICKNDIPILLNDGINGIALSSSVLNADNPIKEMNQIKNIIFQH
ncbi:MAG: thiamine phosphate synthase [Muribaculaceae bacterium]|nr:thiamine phosphate synthase [Muribaculaceae bacterium]